MRMGRESLGSQSLIRAAAACRKFSHHWPHLTSIDRSSPLASGSLSDNLVFATGRRGRIDTGRGLDMKELVLTLLVGAVLLGAASAPPPTPQNPLALIRAASLKVSINGAEPAILKILIGERATISVESGRTIGFTAYERDSGVELLLQEVDSGASGGWREVMRLTPAPTTPASVIVGNVEVVLQLMPGPVSTNDHRVNLNGPCTTCCVFCEGKTYCACQVVTACASCCCPSACACDEPTQAKNPPTCSKPEPYR